MFRLLKAALLFAKFYPSTTPLPKWDAKDSKELSDFLARPVGRKYERILQGYVTSCALGACSKFGDEGSYKNGWAMGAAGLHAYMGSLQFRPSSANDDQDTEDSSGIHGDLNQ